MQTSVIFEIRIKKIGEPNDRGIEYIEKIWLWYRDLLRFIATKYRPTLQFTPDVPDLDKTPTNVAVYVKDQGHGIDYSELLCQLMTTLFTQIKYVETDTIGPSLTQRLSHLLDNFGGLDVVQADLEEIDRISRQIERLVLGYRSAHRVFIYNNSKGNQIQPNPTPVSIQPQLPLLGIDNNPDNDDLAGTENQGYGGNGTKVPPLNPVDLVVVDLNLSFKVLLIRFGVVAGEPCLFGVGKKRKEFLLEETVRLQVMDDIHRYVGRELILEKSRTPLNTYVIVESED